MNRVETISVMPSTCLKVYCFPSSTQNILQLSSDYTANYTNMTSNEVEFEGGMRVAEKQ